MSTPPSARPLDASTHQDHPPPAGPWWKRHAPGVVGALTGIACGVAFDSFWVKLLAVVVLAWATQNVWRAIRRT